VRWESGADGEFTVETLEQAARGTSVTRALTAAFRNSWLGRHPSGNVVRDVFSLIELTEITFIHADRHRGAAAATSRAAALTALSS